MSVVKLALYKGKGQIGNALIRRWTGSQYSHCELVVDGVAYSSSIRDGGVRAKVIEFDDAHWDVVALPDCFAWKIEAHFAATRGAPYGWRDLLLSQVLNTARNESGAAFCSEWCAAALGLPNSTTFSPKTLFDLVEYLIFGPWSKVVPPNSIDDNHLDKSKGI